MMSRIVFCVPAVASFFLLFLLSFSLLSPVCWHDEIVTIGESISSYNELINLLSTKDVYPPLYHTFIHFIASLLNIDIGSPLVLVLVPIVKVVSFALMLAIFAFIFSVVSAQRGKDAALSCILLCFSLPAFEHYSCEIRPYHLCAFFVALGFMAGIKAIQSGNRKWWFLYSLCVVVSEYSHYYALVTIYLISGGFFVYCCKYEKKHIIPLLSANFAAFILFLPWVPTLLEQLDRVRAVWWNPARLRETPRILMELCCPEHGALSCLYVFSVFIIVCFSIYKAYKKKEKLSIFIILSGFLIIPAIYALCVINSIINGQVIIMLRYLYFGIIVYAIGVVWAASYLPKRVLFVFNLFLVITASFSLSNHLGNQWLSYKKFASIQSYIAHHDSLFVYMTPKLDAVKLMEFAICDYPGKTLTPIVAKGVKVEQCSKWGTILSNLYSNNYILFSDVNLPFYVVVSCNQFDCFKEEIKQYPWNCDIKTITSDYYVVHVTESM